MTQYLNKCTYTSATKMSELVLQDYRYLLTLKRFGIPLGFGNQTIAEVCQSAGADTDTFLLVVNTLAEPAQTESFPLEAINVPLVMAYLKNTHTYFIHYRLPKLHVMLRELIKGADELHGSLLLEFFEKYETEVCRHMEYEEKYVYPYVINRYEGKDSGPHTIDYYESHHNDIEKKLNDLRNIIIKYLPPLKDTDQMNDLLIALFQSEEDLNRHTFIEEHIVFPAVRYYESKNE